MQISNSPFVLKSVADGELKRLAISIISWLEKLPEKFDLAVNFPLSQIVDPKAQEVNNILMGQQYTDTIPLAILTRFPYGKILVAIFDGESEDDLTSKLLINLGIKVIVRSTFSNITPRDIKSALVIDRKSKSYERKSVGFQQYQAFKIIANRLNQLQDFNPFTLLHEIRASSVSAIKHDAIHTNKASWAEIWSYIKTTSFDCVVVSKDDWFPLLAVEFDGQHHQNDDQKFKDSKKNAYCNMLSLPLIRINECFLNENIASELLSYQKSFYLQGLIFKLLGQSYLARSKSLSLDKSFSKFANKHRDINPAITLEMVMSMYWSDEYISTSNTVNSQTDSFEEEQNNNEFEAIYGVKSKIEFSTDKFSRISASLLLPQLGSKKTLLLTTPTAIKVEIFGIDNFNNSLFVKDYIKEYMLDLAIAAGKGY